MTTTEQVLRHLEEHRGVPQSGETIAEEFSISRTAVWKAVKSLREAGYEIIARPKKGYYLPMDSDILSREAVEAYLRAGEADWERAPGSRPQIYVKKEATSTNRELSEMALQGAPTRTVLVTGAQTNGRGHRNHRFSSPEGGLYMSILLRDTDLPFEGSAQITAAGALAVKRAVQRVTGQNLGIRWVNDLYLNGKKVCGILTEGASDLESGQLKWIVLGIGINYRTSPTDYPEEIRDRITSLYPAKSGEKEDIGHRPEEDGVPPRAKLVAEILKELLYHPQTQEERMKQYRDSLDQKGKEVIVTPIRNGEEQRAERFTATVEDVDDGMQLVITTEGRRQSLKFGEASIE